MSTKKSLDKLFLYSYPLLHTMESHSSLSNTMWAKVVITGGDAR